MPTLRTIYLLLVCILIWPAVSNAQFAPGQWEQTAGPYGGNFHALAQDPVSGHLWASVDNAVYFSTDGGASWTMALASHLGETAFAFYGNTIFAGPFVSRDSGTTWQPLSLPDSLVVRNYALDAASGNLLAATNIGLFHSTDEGITWTEGVAGNMIGVWSFGNQYLFAGATGDFPRWLYSSDGGQNWRVQRFGVPIGIAQGPDDVLYLMSATSDDTTFTRTNDFGATWLSGGPSNCGGRNLIGITTAGDLLYQRNGIIKLPLDNSSGCKQIFLNQQVFTNSTLTGPLKAVLLGLDDQLYIDTGLGELLSTADGGETWERLDIQGIVGTSVHAIATDDETGEIWAGTALHGLFTSIDAGENWTHSGFTGHITQTLSNGSRSAPEWLVSDQDGLLRKDPATQSWQTYAPGGIQLAPYPPLYNTTTQTNFFRTNNNVFHAQAESNTLTGIPTPANFFSLPTIAATALGTDNTLYAIIRHKAVERQKGFFRLTDPSGAWELVADSMPGTFTATSLLTMDSAAQLWTTSDSTLYSSLDLGKTWEREDLSTGIINALLETPDGSIWVAHGRGLSRTTNGGASWEPMEDGLQHKTVLSLAWHEKEGLLLAGTALGGMYKIALAPPVEVSRETNQHTTSSIEAEHFPNPAYASATIHFTLPEPTVVRIHLFDALGREIKQLVNRNFTTGSHQVEVSFDALPPGVYIYSIETSRDQLSRMIMHVR